MLGRGNLGGNTGAWWRWAAVGLYSSLALVLTDLLVGEGEYVRTPQLEVAFAVYGWLGVPLAVRAWRHPKLDRRSRRAWGLIAVAYLLVSTSGMLRSLYPAEAAFPSPADVLRLAFVPVLLAGLLMLPLRVQGRGERRKVWLDVAIVVVASGMLLWYLQIGPSVAQAGRIPGQALAAAIAYPALDLILIFGAMVVLLRGAGDSARRPAALLVAGMLSLVAGDTYLGYQRSHLGQVAPDRWQYACWLTGELLLTMAAFAQCRQAGRHRLHTEASKARAASYLPYAAIAIGYALLLLATAGISLRVLGLVVGAMAMTAVVVVRQVVAIKENYELAVTDVLTGLANRRQCHDSLQLALVRSARSGQGVAVLLVDMNGFKQINDTLGHEAGDQLLVAFGQILKRNVLGLDTVGRLGGDEFAVVLNNIATADNALAVVRRIVAEMEHPVLIADTPVQPRAAIGIALAAPGQLAVDDLLHHADVAMYRAKQQQHTCWALNGERTDDHLTTPR